MNRRGFFASLGAAIVGAFAAAIPTPRTPDPSNITSWYGGVVYNEHTGVQGVVDFQHDTFKVALIDPPQFDQVTVTRDGRTVQVPRLRGECKAVFHG